MNEKISKKIIQEDNRSIVEISKMTPELIFQESTIKIDKNQFKIIID